MKKLILGVAIATSSLTFAQNTVVKEEKTLPPSPIKFGIKGGLNVSHLGIDRDSKAGFNVGAFANIPLGSSFSLQPELVYSQYGAFVKRDVTLEYDNYPRLNLGYITAPVMLQYNVSPRFYFEAGPEFGYLASAKYSVVGTANTPASSTDIKGVNKFNLGLGLGLGYYFTKNFGFNVRYTVGLTHAMKSDNDVIKNSNINPVTNNVLQLGLTYKFK
jgi:opacity protein-like surface antigen